MTVGCGERDCFLHRLGEWTWLQQMLNGSLSAYGNTKQRHALLAKVLDGAEAIGSYGTQVAQPYYEHYAFDTVASASKFACSKLDVLESKVPAVKMSTGQLYSMPSSYYDGSVVQRGVSSVVAVPTYTRQKCQSALLAVHSSLDYADSLVDKYVADDSVESTSKTVDDSVLTRVSRLGVTTVSGVYGNSKRTLNNVRDQIASLDEYRQSAVSRASSIKDSVRDQTTKYGQQPSLVILNSAQLWSSAASYTSAYVLHMLSTAGDKVPQLCITPVRLTDDMMRNVNNMMYKAQSLGELKESVVSSAGTGMTLALDYCSNWAPLKWMVGESTVASV
jgi:hypothetical protein